MLSRLHLSREREGELFILGTSLLGSFFPIITILSYSSISPLFSLAWSTTFAALFFTLVLTLRRQWNEIKNKAALKDVVMMALFIAVSYYVLIFTGLKTTSAGNASIILSAEIFFSYLFFNVWHEEHISPLHIAGAVLMVAGTLIILLPNFTGFKSGDILIFFATAIPPIGNFWQRRARSKIGSDTILFLRSAIAAPVIFLLAYLFGERFTITDIKLSMPFLLINGIFLFGIAKVLWIEAIHRIPITKANALGSITPLFTLFFVWLILKDVPTIWQLISVIPIILGTILLTSRQNKPSLDVEV